MTTDESLKVGDEVSFIDPEGECDGDELCGKITNVTDDTLTVYVAWIAMDGSGEEVCSEVFQVSESEVLS